jgi:hypothetical protein
VLGSPSRNGDYYIESNSVIFKSKKRLKKACYLLLILSLIAFLNPIKSNAACLLQASPTNAWCQTIYDVEGNVIDYICQDIVDLGLKDCFIDKEAQ